MTGVFIDSTEFATWPAALQTQVMEQILGSRETAAKAAIGSVSAPPDLTGANEHFAELSPGQARDFLAGCTAKTKAAIAVMARSETRFFHMRDVAIDLSVPVSELRGVWSGLTRRLRTVTGDVDAYLVYWHGDGIYDGEEDDAEYVDHVGELTEMTHASFRKALAIS